VAGAFGQTQTAQSGQEGSAALKTGIQVHGHWVVEVRNPDKTLVSHTEFENAVTPGGAGVTQDLLMGSLVPGGWGVFLNTAKDFTAPNGFYILQSGVKYASGPISDFINGLVFQIPSACNSSPGVGCSTSLTVTNPPFQLSGIVFAGNTPGTISGVASILQYCTSNNGLPLNTSPTSCYGGTATSSTGALIFTEASLPLTVNTTAINPIPFQAGQVIQVTVTITFS
jgi:hypothetical protein